jgi:hypothetical protein
MQQPGGCIVNFPPYEQPPDDDQITRWVHWISPHWGYLITLALAAVGAIWRAASLVSEIRALRRDHNRFMEEYRRDAFAWRGYVDAKFNAVNERLDNLADK